MRHSKENLKTRSLRGRPWLALVALSLSSTACASRSAFIALQPEIAVSSIEEACASTAFRPWASSAMERREIRVAIHVEDNTLDGWSHMGTRRLEGVLSVWNRVNLPVRLVVSQNWQSADVQVLVLRRLPADKASANTLASYQAGVTRAEISAAGFMQRAFVAIGETSPAGASYSVPEQLGTLQHEIGHALGLPHALETGALMSKVMTVNDLTRSDIRFARAVYSSENCRRPNDEIANAVRPGPAPEMY